MGPVSNSPVLSRSRALNSAAPPVLSGLVALRARQVSGIAAILVLAVLMAHLPLRWAADLCRRGRSRLSFCCASPGWFGRDWRSRSPSPAA